MEQLEALYWKHVQFLENAADEYERCEQEVLEMVEALPGAEVFDQNEGVDFEGSNALGGAAAKV